jgi:hypothetical protein
MFLDTALTSSWGFVSALLFMTDPLLNDPFRAAVSRVQWWVLRSCRRRRRGGRLEAGTGCGLNAASDSE